MAKTENIQVRVSPDDKQQAKELFERYGLNLSSAVNLFIRRALQENRLPFSFDDVSTQTGNQSLVRKTQ